MLEYQQVAGKVAQEMNVGCDIHGIVMSTTDLQTNFPSVSLRLAISWDDFASAYKLRYHTPLRYSSELILDIYVYVCA